MEIVLGIGIAVGFGIVIWVLVQWLKSMQNTVSGSASEMNRRLDEAARVIGALNKHVGEMSEMGRGIRSLQEFLQSPKLRGNIGEQVLKDMIGQTFPKNSFHLQYSFKSGVKVDAVLKTDAGLLCIDSKFPMENFTVMHKGETEAIRVAAKRDFVADVKRHITDISRKYILPEEGTMDFALMYIPSESVYYEIATIEELMEFSRRARVYPVSPNTLYAHLQVLLLSFQGKELEQKSREVFRLLRAIQKDYEKTGEQLGVLGRHIGNAYNTMSGVSGSFDVLGQKLSRTQRFTGKEEKELEE
jgi:DNA recombination protein RmuC